VIATLSRYLLAGSLLVGPTMAKLNPARFFWRTRDLRVQHIAGRRHASKGVGDRVIRATVAGLLASIQILLLPGTGVNETNSMAKESVSDFLVRPPVFGAVSEGG
jgi:hypothetical protein